MPLYVFRCLSCDHQVEEIRRIVDRGEPGPFCVRCYPLAEVKWADQCPPCPDCSEPWCVECREHYSECNHPGPDSERMARVEAVRTGRPKLHGPGFYSNDYNPNRPWDSMPDHAPETPDGQGYKVMNQGGRKTKG